MKFEDIDFTDLEKARVQIRENYAELKAELVAKLKPEELALLPLESGKTLPNQQNEPEINPRPTRDESEINPSELGIILSKPGKLARPKPKRSALEPSHGPRGFLNELPQDVQLSILDLIDETSYIDAAAKLTSTLGRRVTKSALERFDNRQKLIHLKKERETLAAHAKELNKLETPDSEFTSAIDRIVRSRLLELAPRAERFETLERLTRIVERLRRADLTESRTQIQKAP